MALVLFANPYSEKILLRSPYCKNHPNILPFILCRRDISDNNLTNLVLDLCRLCHNKLVFCTTKMTLVHERNHDRIRGKNA